MSAPVPNDAGRVPPNDLDAERAVLAAVLLDSSALAKVRPLLDDAAWFNPAHRDIWRAVRGVADAGQPVDVITVKGRLSELNWLERVGGSRYFGDLVDATPAVANVEAHARIVVEKGRLRRLIEACHETAAVGYTAADVDALRAELLRRVEGDGPTDNATRWITAADMAVPLPPVDWVVGGLQVAAGRPNMVVGRSASAKTLFVQSMALSVATGRLFLGQFSTGRGGPVAHIDMDQGCNATKRRYQRLAAAADIDLAGLGDSLRLLSPPPIALTDNGAEAWLTRELAGARLCVLDSLVAACPGVDENDARIVQYMHLLWRVSEATGCAIVVVHHEGKSRPGDHRDARDGPRGSSAIIGACGTVVSMAGPVDAPRLVSCTKPSAEGDGQFFEPFYVRPHSAAVGTDPDAGLGLAYMTREQVDPPKNPSAELDRVAMRVLEVLAQRPGASGTELRSLVGGGVRAVDGAVAMLLRQGAIRTGRGPGRGAPTCHYLVAGGQSLSSENGSSHPCRPTELFSDVRPPVRGGSEVERREPVVLRPGSKFVERQSEVERRADEDEAAAGEDDTPPPSANCPIIPGPVPPLPIANCLPSGPAPTGPVPVAAVSVQNQSGESWRSRRERAAAATAHRTVGNSR